MSAAAWAAALLLCGPAAAAGAAPVPPPNVLLIVVDSLRADRVGAYGRARDATPNLDALAGQGVLFENAVSAANWTLPATASILTGLYPRVHGAQQPYFRKTRDFAVNLEEWLARIERGGVRLNSRQRLDSSRATLQTLLARAGYDTAVFTTNAFFAPSFGLAEGFALAELSDPSEGRLGLVVPRISAWMRARAGRPFFAYVHAMDVHFPYYPGPGDASRWGPGAVEPPKSHVDLVFSIISERKVPSPDEVRRLRDRYDAAVAYEDAAIGALLEDLRRSGRDRDTLVIVTADHGEQFYEHGGFSHGSSLHEEEIHVPLIARLPSGARGARVKEVVRGVDLFPTILEAAGVPVPAGVDGASLLPALRGGAVAARPGLSEMPPQSSLRLDRWKVMVGSASARLFDLSADAEERRDLSSREAGRLAALRRRLSRMLADLDSARARAPARDGEPVMDEATARNLRDLGYLNR